MTTKSKSVLIILSTLVMGVIIGILIGGAVRDKSDRRVDFMRRQQNFQHTMTEIIQPTDQQRQAIESTLTKRFKQIATIQEKHQDEIFAIYDSLQADLASILSEEQRLRLEQELERGKHRVVRSRVNRLAHELDLSAEQRDRISELLSKMEEEIRRQGPPDDWQAHREEMRQRFHQLNEEIEALLTPEQLKKIRATRKHRRPFFGPQFQRRPMPGPPMKPPIE